MEFPRVNGRKALKNDNRIIPARLIDLVGAYKLEAATTLGYTADIFAADTNCCVADSLYEPFIGDRVVCPDIYNAAAV